MLRGVAVRVGLHRSSFRRVTPCCHLEAVRVESHRGWFWFVRQGGRAALVAKDNARVFNQPTNPVVAPAAHAGEKIAFPSLLTRLSLCIDGCEKKMSSCSSYNVWSLYGV